MQILVDADALPGMIKDVLLRAAERERIAITFVANEPVRLPESPYLDFIVAVAGPDEADDRIAEMVEPDDLVVSADIPLADRVVKAGGVTLDPRGQLQTAETIGQRLAVRNLMEEIRATGIQTGGPPPFNKKDVQAFANRLDAYLARYHRSRQA